MKNITVQSFYTGGFEKARNDGERHVKALPCLSVVQATEGRYSFGLDGGPLGDTGPGGFFVAPALRRQEIIHHTAPETGTMSARWLFLQVYVDDFIPFDRYFTLPVFLPPEGQAQLNRVFEGLFGAETVLDRKIYCYQCLKVLLPYCRKNPGADGHLSQAMACIREHFAQPLTVGEIAEKAGISPSYLYALFKKELDMSPIAYLNGIRLSQACMLLEHTDKSVRQIAEACGIPDSYYFSKLFKKKYALPPLRYRQQLRR